MTTCKVRCALMAGLALGMPVAAFPALAQQGQMAAPASAARAVVPVPGAGNQALNNALARLGRDPRDVNALIDAGNAALGMGDVDAALGFFARADQLSPNNARVRAGLGGAMVRSGNPYDAIPVFAEAEAAGGMDASLGTERGLAYDLVGDNATAQRYYRAALAAAPNDEATRRLALSLAISGDETGMETALAPLLQKQDKAAWRTRAFALAVLNQPDEAVQIAYQTMPKDLAAGIAPYLRYMPRLTKAQQAAAATFGHFPRAAEIGHDDPRALRFAPPTRMASADAALVPRGEPLGSKGHSAKDSRAKDSKASKGSALAVASPPAVPVSASAPRTAPPELQPRRDESEAVSRVAATAEVPAAAPLASVATPAPVTPPVRVAAAPRPVQPAASKLPSKPIGPGFDLAQTPGTTAVARIAPTQPAPTVAAAPVAPPVAVPVTAQPVATQPVASQPVAPQPTAPLPPALPPVAVASKPAPPPSAPPPAPRKFADLFGDLLAPSKGAASPAPGAVDIRKLKPAALKVEVPVKPAHPSRIWIQVGTGRDKSALAFSWKSILRDEPDLFRGKSPAISEWGRTNRLLVGPFETEAAANSFFARLRKEKVDSFVWTSPAGQIVDPLLVK